MGNRLLGSLALAILGLTRPAQATTPTASGVALQLKTPLFKSEPYFAQAFQGGYLWEGSDWSPDKPYPRVDVFTADGLTPVQEIKLPHSASYIYPYGPNSVIVSGKAYDQNAGWQTYFTVINTSDFQAQTSTLPVSVQADQFAVDGDRVFFTDPGSAAVYQVVGGEIRPVGPSIAAPEQMALDGNSLYVIQQPNIMELGHENVYKIDLETETAAASFPAPRKGLVALLPVRGGNFVAASETLMNQVLFIDKSTNHLTAAVKVAGHPWGLTQLGHCVVAVTDDTQRLFFIDTQGNKPSLVTSWDLSSAGLSLKLPRQVSADEATGRLFIRSAYPCPSCGQTMSNVYAAEEASHSTFDRCIK